MEEPATILYHVDNAADTIVELSGTDNVNASVSYTLGAGVSVETLRTSNAAATTAINLTGNELANVVTGNAGVNTLKGGSGNDTLAGMGGNDKLTGGGNDFFLFNTAPNASSNMDTILDFNVAQDTIRLENAIFTALTAGPLAPGAFNKGAAATQADDRIVYNSANGALIYDSNGNASGGAVQFAQARGRAQSHQRGFCGGMRSGGRRTGRGLARLPLRTKIRRRTAPSARRRKARPSSPSHALRHLCRH